MWLEELESRLKDINKKIERTHTQAEKNLEKLRDLYKQRDDTIENLLKDEDN